jgi:hypothetical protein
MRQKVGMASQTKQCRLALSSWVGWLVGWLVGLLAG